MAKLEIRVTLKEGKIEGETVDIPADEIGRLEGMDGGGTRIVLKAPVNAFFDVQDSKAAIRGMIQRLGLTDDGIGS